MCYSYPHLSTNKHRVLSSDVHARYGIRDVLRSHSSDSAAVAAVDKIIWETLATRPQLYEAAALFQLHVSPSQQ